MPNDLTIDSRWTASLAAGIAELGLDIDEVQQTALLRYIALLHCWNRVYNLTAVREPMQMIPRHLLDSLAVSRHLHGGRILDVGTGPGLPGIPLAITQPHREFTLLDGNGKKLRFVRQTALELGLENVQIEQTRVESFNPTRGFDTILTRAFAALPDILAKTARLLRPGGRLLAMKGRYPEDELASLKREGLEISVTSLHVPRLDAERHVVSIGISSVTIHHKDKA